MEMVDSVDELISSRSVTGKNSPNFEMLDAKIASAFSVEQQKSQKEDQFLRGRHIAFMIHDCFRVTGAHDTALDHADLFSVTLHDDNFQEFDTRWDEVLLFVSKIPSDDVLECLYKLRIRESAPIKTILELYEMEIHQKISMPNGKKGNNGEKEYGSETTITQL